MVPKYHGATGRYHVVSKKKSEGLELVGFNGEKAESQEWAFSFDSNTLEVTLDQLVRTLQPSRVFIASKPTESKRIQILATRGYEKKVTINTASVTRVTLEKILEGEPETRTFEQDVTILCAPIHTAAHGSFGLLYVEYSEPSNIGAAQMTWLASLGRALGKRVETNRVTRRVSESKVAYEALPTREEIWNELRLRGLAARRSGDLELSEEALNRTLLYCRCRGLKGLHLARTLNDLSEVRRLKGKLDEAKTLLDESIALLESHPEVDILSSLPFFNNLAGLHYERGQTEEAAKIYGSLLQRLEKADLTHSSQNVMILSNLGTLYLRNEQFGDAQSFLRKAHKLAIGIFGPENDVTLDCLSKYQEAHSRNALPDRQVS